MEKDGEVLSQKEEAEPEKEAMIDTTDVESKLNEAQILDKEENAREEVQESSAFEQEVEEKAEEPAEGSY